MDLLPYTLVLPGAGHRVRSGLFLLAAVGVAALAVGWAPVRVLLAVVGLPPALVLVTGPLRLAFRIGWSARYGVMASAVVSGGTDDEVVCQVQGPRGSFQAAVELDDLPAPEPADRMLVIVHPEEDEVLWCLGSPRG